jgi:hypothetical protein
MWRVKKRQNPIVVRQCEIIADNLSKAGWSWRRVSALDCRGRTIWIADTHRGDGKRFVVPMKSILRELVVVTAGLAVEHGFRKKHSAVDSTAAATTLKRAM